MKNICFLLVVVGVSQSIQARVFHNPLSRQVLMRSPSFPETEGLGEDSDLAENVLSHQKMEVSSGVKQKVDHVDHYHDHDNVDYGRS